MTDYKTDIIKVKDFAGICEITYKTPENYHSACRLFPSNYNKTYAHPDLHTTIDGFYLRQARQVMGADKITAIKIKMGITEDNNKETVK